MARFLTVGGEARGPLDKKEHSVWTVEYKGMAIKPFHHSARMIKALTRPGTSLVSKYMSELTLNTK